MDVGDDELALLNGFPEGTAGHRADAMCLKELRDLCRVYGYGPVAMMAGWMEELARDPAAAGRFRRARAERVAAVRKEMSGWKHQKAKK